jgi:hypothetical protein
MVRGRNHLEIAGVAGTRNRSVLLHRTFIAMSWPSWLRFQRTAFEDFFVPAGTVAIA